MFGLRFEISSPPGPEANLQLLEDYANQADYVHKQNVDVARSAEVLLTSSSEGGYYFGGSRMVLRGDKLFAYCDSLMVAIPFHLRTQVLIVSRSLPENMELVLWSTSLRPLCFAGPSGLSSPMPKQTTRASTLYFSQAETPMATRSALHHMEPTPYLGLP